MRTIILLVALIILLCCCNESKKGTIQFKQIGENDLNYPADTTFAVPHGRVWDEMGRIHDSCMGSSYAVNAIFIRTKDTIPLGSIVDRKTMKVVKYLPFFSDTTRYLSSLMVFETKPCYEKRAIDIPIDSFLNHTFLFKIDSTNNKINDELVDAVRNTVLTEIESGSWINMELTNALGKVLDTTTNEKLLDYKRALLDTSNMILVRSSAVSEISFYFHSAKPLPADLLNKLATKPVSMEQSYFRSQFFYIDNSTFEFKVNGYFQVMGQFMKCELE